MQFITRIGDKNGQIIDFKDSEISLIASAYNSSAAGRGDSHLVITILSAHCDELHVRSVQPPVFDSTPELETSEETSRTGP